MLSATVMHDVPEKTPSDPILYSFRRCPFAMRARLAIAVSGVQVELREVKLSAKPPEMVLVSPKGTVPVLDHGGGANVTDESLDIMRWALRIGDPEAWLDRDDPILVATNDGAFKHDLDRYKYPERHGSDPIAHRAAGLAFLRTLEARLVSSAHVCGATRGFADAAIMPFVRQFASVDRAWFAAQPLPALKAWLAAHLGSALFDAAMVRLPPWVPGDVPVRWPDPAADGTNAPLSVG